MSRTQLFAVFFFAVFFYLLYQTYRIFTPFLVPISWGAVLALTFFPVHTRLMEALRGRATLSATLLTVLLVLVVTVPTVLFGSVLIRQAATLYANASNAMEQGGLQAAIQRLTDSPAGGLWQRTRPYLEQYDLDLANLAHNSLTSAWKVLADQVTGAARNLVVVLFNFLITVMTFFVCLRGGKRFVAQLQDAIPMEREHSDAILRSLLDTLSGVVQAMLATAIAQGILSGIGYWLAGVPFSLLLSVLSGFLSLIPYAVPIIWASCAVYLVTTGATGAAIFLGIWGLAVVGSVDNIVRPLIIGERAKLSAFLLFFAILGGLALYGFLGLLLGPVVVATVLTFLRIYREDYVAPPGSAT